MNDDQTKALVELSPEEVDFIDKKRRRGNEPRKPKKLPVALDYNEFIALLKATRKKEHKIAYLLGFGSGLRISEILKLEPRHIMLDEKKILIEQGKGSKDRIVPLPKGFKEEYVKIFPLKFKSLNSGSRSLQLSFRRAARRAGLLKNKPTLHFHSLRHGFATRCVSQGIPIHHVMNLLGHSNLSTTSVYLQSNPKEALDSFEKLF